MFFVFSSYIGRTVTPHCPAYVFGPGFSVPRKKCQVQLAYGQMSTGPMKNRIDEKPVFLKKAQMKGIFACRMS